MAATGRKPRIRAEYMDDARLCLLTARAITDDKFRPLEWRERIAKLFMDLAQELLNAPPRKLPTL